MPASIKHLTDKKLNLTSLLARWKDGLYYTAAIVKCDKTNKKCLVCFEDGSEVWVNNRDVHIQLSLEQLNQDEDIVCCICDDGCSEPPNEIILCDVCQQGYHQRCHNPPVDSSKIDESEDTNDHKDWFCATCSYILNQSNRAKLSASAQKQQPEPQQSQPEQQAPPLLQPKPKSQQPTQPKPQQSPQPKPQQSPQPKQQQSPQPKPQQSPQPKSQQSPQPKSQPSQQQQVLPQQKSKLPSRIKSQSEAPQTQPQQKSTIGPVKATTYHVEKPAPYYPLSNQTRVVATSSTAALASMTASSALVVGSSAGRTKPDLVNQGNRNSHRQPRPPTTNVEVISAPVKHAVRKSSVNFVIPVRQSALPTATRSVLPSTPPPQPLTTPPTATTTKLPNLMATTAITPPQPVTTTKNPISKNNNINNNNNNNNNAISTEVTKDKQPQVTLQAPPTKKPATWTLSTQSLVIAQPSLASKSNDGQKDLPPSNVIANNNCKQPTLADDNLSVNLSASTTRDASGSGIIVPAATVQPTVIVSADSKFVRN